MHTLKDANGHILVFMQITAATLHDVNAMDQLSYEQVHSMFLIADTSIIPDCIDCIMQGRTL